MPEVVKGGSDEFAHCLARVQCDTTQGFGGYRC
jgi:hypothetical protein